MHESQKNRILKMLQNQEFVCTSFMYASYIADPRKRICELKKKYELEWRWCKNPTHNHQGQMKEWKLVGLKENKMVVLTGYVAPEREIFQGKLL